MFFHVIIIFIIKRASNIAMTLSRSPSPGSQAVTSRWRVDWLTYLASRKGFVIVFMDVSGSGGSGDKTRKSVHRRLGVLESSDVEGVIR